MNEQASEATSPLELFHPAGAGVAVLRLGGDGDDLPAASKESGSVDLIMIEPTRQQWRSRAWLEQALAQAVPRLASDGIVYVVTPIGRRRRARRLLRRHALVVGPEVVHVPSFPGVRYLVPLEPDVASWAFKSVVAHWPRKRGALAALLRLPKGAAVVSGLLPSMGLVGRRAGAARGFEWLARAAGEPSAHVRAVVATSGRGEDDRLVALWPRTNPSVSLIAKVRSEGCAALEREAVNLLALGPAAGAAGARIPGVRVAPRPLGDACMFLQSGLSGDSAAAHLTAHPRSFARVLSLLVDWLEAWARMTVVRTSMTADDLERRVLLPAEDVIGALSGGVAYRAWLVERCRVVAARPVPFVAAHNDLTMFNVLIDDEQLGVVDWEAASEQQLPLTDFVYAAVDAAGAAARYVDRAAAVGQCFGHAGRFIEVVASGQRRLAGATETSGELTRLSFHACWLHHAANEQRARAQSPHRPFLAVLEQLAAAPESWPARRI